MSIVELIEYYDALGVRFWVDDGQLRFRAPSGTLNVQRMEELRNHKKDLIDYLMTHENEMAVHDAKNRFEPFPLTPIQGAYLVGRSSGYEFGGVGCHGYVELFLPSLEKRRLEKAWHSLILRHDMLRAVVLQNGYQKVFSDVSLPEVKEHDLRGADASQVQSGISKIRSELSNKQYVPDEWPLFDLALTTMDEGCILHFSIDMLIADFISIDLLLDELDQLYHTPEKSLPDLEVTFRDLLLFERSLQDKPFRLSEKENDRQYWLSRIDSMPDAPELPMNTKLQVPKSVSFERHAFKMDEKSWAFFCHQSGAHKITPSVAILSAFSEVICRWSKQTRFCLNITVLIRPEIHPQVNKVVGDYTEVNILEVDSDMEKTFLQRTHVLQDRLWQDMEHRGFSGIEVLREMGSRRGKRVVIPVVFTSMLGLGNNRRETGQFMREARLNYGISQTPQVLIDCQVSEQYGELLLNWDVRSGIFPEGMIEDAFGAFSQLLNEIGEKEKIWQHHTPLKLPAHVKTVRTAVNNTDGEFPKTLLHDGFYHSMQNYPDTPALVCINKQFTYKELGIHIAAVQQALLHEKCTNGDIVVVALKKGVWQVAAVLGALFAGGAYLPIDTIEPRARMDSILEDSGAKFVLTSGELAREQWPEHVCVIDVEKLVLDQTQLPKPKKVNPRELAYIIYTSGSTGKPKGVMMTHKAAQNTIQDINKRFNVDADDKILCLAKLNFDLSVYDIFGLLAAGGVLVMPDADRINDPSHWFDLIEKNGITIWDTVPAQMHMLLTYLDTKGELTGGNTPLRIAMLSGDWIPPKLPGMISRHYPDIKIVSLGGATEGGIWSIFYEIGDVLEGETSIPYGTPLANQQIYILNDHMQPCPDWTIGDIYIGGASLSSGYLKDPERTHEQFIVHPHTEERLYKTGDLGRYRPDGVVEFLGREDTQVKIRGFRIELGEIEKITQDHPEISLAVAIITGKSSLDRQLAVFAEAQLLTEQDETSINIPDLKKSCFQASRKITSEIDHTLLEQWLNLADKAAMLNMVENFRRVGLFTNTKDKHSIDEIQAALNIKREFNGLIERWLNVLCTEDMLKSNDEKSYSLPVAHLEKDVSSGCWAELEEIEKRVHFSEKLLRFLKIASENLPELLCGNADPIELFFPKGKLETALAAYSDNLSNRHLNYVVREGVISIAKQHKIRSKHPLRILEIGAGTGGTTVGLLPELADFEVEYLFTDISQFFINEAQNRFEEYPWVSYGLYDLNKDYWVQNLKAASWDIIICSNVIHNSPNIPVALSTLKELSVPGGFVFIIEGTRESFTWLTSLEFIFRKQGIRFTDERAANDNAFFPHDKWLSMLADIHADTICTYPESEDLFTISGQTVFIAQFPLERASVSSHVLKDYLKSQLPSHMVPDYIEVLPRIPLSNNGKIDRADLIKRVKSIKSGGSEYGEPPKAGLEKSIAEIWCAVLNRNEIGRDEDFFTAGGDSLLVAQVIAKMQKSLPEAKSMKWELLMGDMLKLPTVSAVAKKLRAKGQPADVDKTSDKTLSKTGSSFVILVAGKTEKEAMKIITHTGNGNLASYRHLMPHLLNDPNRTETIAGISVTNVDQFIAIPTSRLIEELGIRYAEEILQYKACRFDLIGYCSGGLLAMEIARNLLESGVEVGPVTIIDTSTFKYRVEDELLMERGFGCQLGADLKKTGHFSDEELLASAIKEHIGKQHSVIPEGFLLSLNGKYASIASCYEKLSSKSQSKRLLDISAAIPGGDKQNNTSEFQEDMLKILLRVFRHTFEAVTAYKPLPFAGDTILLHAKDQSINAVPGIPPNTIEFWKENTLGNLEITDVEGNHLSCMQPPQVSTMTDFLIQRGFKR